MAIPDFQGLLLPVLKAASAGEVRIGEVVERLARELGLTEEEQAELLPSGKQTVFSNRVHWAKTYLKEAGLVESTRWAYFRITDRGRKVLADDPERIDIAYLERFPEFVEFRQRRSSNDAGKPNRPLEAAGGHPATKTPDEVMRSAHQEIESELRSELLERILEAPPSFFERLIVKLLVEMGYGGSVAAAGRALGRSGDGGVDGVIDQDPLGLDPGLHPGQAIRAGQ